MKSNTNYIYLLKTIDDCVKYKIGVSKNPKKRVKQLKTGNPNGIELLQFFESIYAYKIESKLHKEYKSNKLDGEWFVFEDDSIEYTFLSRCIEIHDYLKLILTTNTYINENTN